MLQIHFVGVQSQVKPLLQPVLHFTVHIHDPFLVSCYNDKIIDKPQIAGSYLVASFQDEMIHERQIEVRK